MMMVPVDGSCKSVSNGSPWRDRFGVAAMVTEHHQVEFREDISDTSDNRLALAILDTRKRKRVFPGGPDATIMIDHNKRNKHEYTEYNGASSDSHLYLVEVSPEKMSLISTAINCVVSSSLIPNNTIEHGASVVNTSYWSSDSYNAGDYEYGRDGASTSNSSEEGSGQRCLYYPFFSTQRTISGFDQAENQRDYSWSGDSNLLQFQLGSFIQKERQKLESKFEDGGCDLSKHSLAAPVPGCESIETITSMHIERSSDLSDCSFPELRCGRESRMPITCLRNERSSGLSEHSLSTSYGYVYVDPVTGVCHEPSRGSGSLSWILGASGFFAESSRAQFHGGTAHSCNTRSLLLSCVRNTEMYCVDFPVQKDTKLARESEERDISSDQMAYHLHQKFILSSGRLRHADAARDDTRASTIDQDFDDYFAELMI